MQTIKKRVVRVATWTWGAVMTWDAVPIGDVATIGGAATISEVEVVVSSQRVAGSIPSIGSFFDQNTGSSLTRRWNNTLLTQRGSPPTLTILLPNLYREGFSRR